MSVKLSELKVPENAPEHFAELIARNLEWRKLNIAECLNWISACAVAALYWRKRAEDNSGCYPASQQVQASAKYLESLDQADLWQRAAFEGVEA